MKLIARVVGDYQVNTILVWDPTTRKAVLFDPCADTEETLDLIADNGLELTALVNTHGHLDHIAENSVVKAALSVPLLIHRLDRPMLTDPAKNLSLITGDPIVSPDADGTLEEGDLLPVGREEMKVFHVPGHSPGSLVFYTPGILIAGDTLFAGSVGRTDLPGCSEQALLENIRTKILTLPDDTVIYPGHGPTTTVGDERRSNPFLRS
jgi:glyoxylase-like metal-dependent hydrolase (beta-lactamase superfamily II)